MRIPAHSGVLVTAVLLAVGAAAAGVAWWNNLSHTRQALDFWGPEAAVAIRDAPQVTAFQITFAATIDGRSIGPVDVPVHPRTGAPVQILQARDISQAKGLVHLRHALLDDRSFDWTTPADGAADLRYALAFEQDRRRLVIFLSADFTRLVARPADAAEARWVSTEPIAAGLRKYFADVLPAEGNERQKDES